MAVIRKANIDDIPAIAVIEEHTSKTPWTSEAITSDVTKNDFAYVAVVCDEKSNEGCDAKVAGYSDMWTIAGEAQLNNIGIEESSRGNGLGEKLLIHMINAAIERCCDVMTLEVRRSNMPAIGLYKKLGFVEVGIRKEYYSDNHEDAILMNKNFWNKHEQ